MGVYIKSRDKCVIILTQNFGIKLQLIPEKIYVFGFCPCYMFFIVCLFPLACHLRAGYWRMTQLRSEQIHMQHKLNEESVYISYCLCFPSVFSMQRLPCSRNHVYLEGPEVMTISLKRAKHINFKLGSFVMNVVLLFLFLHLQESESAQLVPICEQRRSSQLPDRKKKVCSQLSVKRCFWIGGQLIWLGAGRGCQGAQRWKTNRSALELKREEESL